MIYIKMHYINKNTKELVSISSRKQHAQTEGNYKVCYTDGECKEVW